MYIRKFEITNIKSFESFVMDFGNITLPGWHVLIGDNGSGKTTILRCLGMALLEDDFLTVYNMEEFKGESWLRKGASEWELKLSASDLESSATPETEGRKFVHIKYIKTENENKTHEDWKLDPPPGKNENMINEETLDFYFGFAAGYGPFRMLSGGEGSSLGSGRSAFFSTLLSENEGFEQTSEWMKGLKLDEKWDEISFITSFINTSGLLPEGASLTNRIGSHGITIQDPAGFEVAFKDAAAGYRSILSLTLDLIKNLISYYGINEFIESYERREGEAQFQIHLPGVVLIDEVDTHLHPSWQTKIGKLFTTNFPKIQFIITTHSPLICRGAAKGTIWKLPALGSGENAFEITGSEKDKLIYGNILDAFETDEFGENISRGSEGKEKQKRYYELIMKRRFDTPMTEEEKSELVQLQMIFQSNVED